MQMKHFAFAEHRICSGLLPQGNMIKHVLEGCTGEEGSEGSLHAQCHDKLLHSASPMSVQVFHFSESKEDKVAELEAEDGDEMSDSNEMSIRGQSDSKKLS